MKTTKLLILLVVCAFLFGAKNSFAQTLYYEKGTCEFKSPYCVKNSVLSFRNPTEYKVGSFSFKVTVRNASNYYVYLEQRFTIKASINPWSVYTTGPLYLKNGCFIQNAYSMDGIYFEVSDIKANWIKTPEQLAREKRQKQENERIAAENIKKQKEQEKRLKVLRLKNDSLYAKSNEAAESGKYLEALEIISSMSYEAMSWEVEQQKTALYGKAVKGLEESLKEDFDILTDEEVSQVITENVEIIRKLTDGHYDFLVNKSGEVTCLSNPNVKIRNLSTPIIKVRYPQTYKINVNGKFSLNVLTNKEGKSSKNDSVEYHMSSKYKDRFLKKSSSGKYFLDGFGSPFLSDPIPNSKYVEDLEAKDLIVPVYKFKDFDILCNGKYVGVREKSEKVEEIQVSKGTGRKVVKIVTAPIWVSLGLIVLIGSVLI